MYRRENAKHHLINVAHWGGGRVNLIFYMDLSQAFGFHVLKFDMETTAMAAMTSNCYQVI